ncbi:MAG: hemerythrin domain-containing protein [Thermoplasmatales archaeon]|nr:hemerythrin domain-containing protein [Thermoplasmatales archaeon]
MKPRELPVNELIEKLKEEHANLPAIIDDAIITYKTGNLSGAFPVIADVRETLSQHIIDEEAVLLKLLLDRLGKEASEPYIKILQEHTKIMKLVEQSVESTYTGWTETENNLNTLKEELAGHHKQEEEVFYPKVISLLRESSP